MALDVLQCIIDGEHAADQVPGIDGIVVDWGFLLDNGCRWCWRRRLAEQAEYRSPRIGLTEGVDAGLKPALLLEAAAKTLERVE